MRCSSRSRPSSRGCPTLGPWPGWCAKLGSFDGQRGEAAEAEHELGRAYALAVEVGDDPLAADVAIELVRIVGHEQARIEDAEVWVRQAQALVDRTGDPEAAGWLEQQRGLVSQVQHEAEEAFVHHERAFEAMLQTRGYLDERTIIAMVEMSNAARMGGDYDAAVEYAAEALSMAEALGGSDHPLAVQILSDLGYARLRAGDVAQAQDDLERSAAAASRIFGPDHPTRAVCIHLLAEGAWEAGERERWLVLAREAEAAAVRIYGTDHINVCEVRWKLGHRLLEMGRAEDAREPLQSASEWLVKQDTDAMRLYAADTLALLAAARLQTGDRVGAIRALDEAERQLVRAAEIDDPVEVASVELAWLEAATEAGLAPARLEAMRASAHDHLARGGELGLPLEG